MKKFWILFPVLFTALNLISQDYIDFQFREDFREANLLMEEGNYDEALGIWLEKVNNHPENANLNYKTGYAYLNSSKNKKNALQYLRTADELRSDKFSSFNIDGYDPFDPGETNAPPETAYYLGQAYLVNDQLDKALEQFKKANSSLGKKHHLKSKSERYIQTTQNAMEFYQNPSEEINIVNMGPVINSKYDDFSPVISIDEGALYFTSDRARSDSSNIRYISEDGGYFEDIYVSFKDASSEWQSPELLNFNYPDNHLATVNVTPDGQQLYIYDGKEEGGTLKESRMVGEEWTEPVKLGSDINTKHWETHITLTPDGNTMYFVTDRPGGEGGRDIFRVVKLPNGKWSKALALSTQINTPFDEDAPFIHPDGRTLYFASQGHKSIGGFDIFKSIRDDEGNWSQPENIGYPINTVEDDVFYVTSPDNRRAYFSSNREGGYGKKDVYMIELPVPPEEINLAVLKGTIIAADGQELPDITIYISETNSDEVFSYKPRARDGVFVAVLKPCADYDIDYTADGISFKQETITIDCGSSYREIRRELLLDPINLSNSTISKEEDDTVVKSEDDVVQTKTSDDDVTVISTTKDDVTIISTSETGTAFFDVYYGYNQTGTNLAEERFEIFIDDVQKIIEQKGSIDITIEGSASRVPTKTWGTNEKLAKARAEQGQDNLMKYLTQRGIDESKVNVKAVDSAVQGPQYKGDYKNIELYTKFQFLKITGK